MVKLQVLLRRDQRTPIAVERVRKILQSLGIDPTASGLASVSAAVDMDRFRLIFGSSSPAASLQAETIPVPDSLKQYVESITVAPPPIRTDTADNP